MLLLQLQLAQFLGVRSARLQKKMEEFLERRLWYDRFMECFMNTLLEKAKQSPELLKTVSEIKMDIQNQHPKNQSDGSCHN
jgi:hypothetical protein